jgi:hypothetical protein
MFAEWCRYRLWHLLRRQLACLFRGRARDLTVLHRLMVPDSDRHASTWQQGVVVPGAERDPAYIRLIRGTSFVL